MSHFKYLRKSFSHNDQRNFKQIRAVFGISGTDSAGEPLSDDRLCGLRGGLDDKVKRNLEHVRNFFQRCGCSLSPSAFQVGNVTLSGVSLARDVELRFTAPLAK